jgi:hypothetical protein
VIVDHPRKRIGRARHNTITERTKSIADATELAGLFDVWLLERSLASTA